MVADQITAGLAVEAVVLGARPFHFHTRVEEGDAGPWRFLSPQQIVVLAPVKLITEDRLWLGHVVECRPHGDEWLTTFLVEHCLRDLQELLKLASRFD